MGYRLSAHDKLAIMAVHFEKMDRVFSGKNVTCAVQDAPKIPAAAWSMGDSIWFNAAGSYNTMASMEDFVALFGVNYHELAHVIHTPSMDQIRFTPLGSLIHDDTARYMPVFNMLEDQRIENLMVARWPSLKNYYVAMFVKHCMEDVSTAYLIAYGRKYLPAQVRQALRQAFPVPKMTRRKFRAIINEYIQLDVWTADGNKRAAELIKAMADLMSKELASPPEDPCKDTHEGGAGKKEPDEKNGEEAQQAVKKMMQADPDDDAAEDGEPSAITGQPLTKEELDEVKGKLQAAMTAAQESEDVRREIQAAQKQIAGSGAVVTSHGLSTYPTPVTAPMRKMAADIAKELRKVEDEVDSGWNHGTNDGKLNVLRAMNRNPYDDGLFDRWDPGNNPFESVSVMVLLDRSGSMKRHIHQLSMAGWVMQKALNDVKAETVTWAYDTESLVLYKPGEKADPKHYKSFRDAGNTHPYQSMYEAYLTLQRSKRPRKLLLVMTDGVWSQGLPMGKRRITGAGTPSSADGLIQKMNADGILTALFNLDDNEHATYQDHGTRLHTTATDIMRLPVFMRQVVSHMIRMKVRT